MILRKLKHAIRDERGSELLEFGLAATIFLTTVLCIADLSRAMYVYHFVTYAAQQGARFAVVRGNTWGSSCNTSAPPNFTIKYQCTASATDVQNFVQSIGTVNSSNLAVSTTWPGTTPDCTSGCSACSTTNAQGCMVKVKVTYSFKFITPFIQPTSVSFYGTSEKVIQE